MPRPRGHYGRPSSQVIPTGWAERHRPVLDGTHTGRITLRAPGTVTGPVDDTTGRRPTAGRAPYAVDVPCRVQVLATIPRQADAADDQVRVTGYQVTVPVTHNGSWLLVEPGHIGLLAGTDDPLLDDHDVLVDDVTRGTQLFERVLLCTLTT